MRPDIPGTPDLPRTSDPHLAGTPDPAQTRPTLVGDSVTLRPGHPGDVAPLCTILSEESVAYWWGEPASSDQVAADLSGDADRILLVIEVDGQVAGGIQYTEQDDPSYHFAMIDICLGDRFQDRGTGTIALRLLARFLFEQRGHHRLMIDPAAANTRAIRCYEKLGFRPVGIMRRYERLQDGRFRDGLLMDLLREELITENRDTSA